MQKQNPDVNSVVTEDIGSDEDTRPGRGEDNGNIEGIPDREPIPVPPDVEEKAPIEEPPGRDGPPVGDVDDSPKRIVHE